MSMKRLASPRLVLVATEKPGEEYLAIAVKRDLDTQEIEVLLLSPGQAKSMNLLAIPENAETRKIAKGKWRFKPSKPSSR